MSQNKYAHSAKEGFGHWYWQRITGLALAILVIWFAYFLVVVAGDAEVSGINALILHLGSPFNATMMILLVLATGFHASLGMQVIIEDYIHAPATHQIFMIGQRLFCIFLSALGVISVLKIIAASSPLLIGAL